MRRRWLRRGGFVLLLVAGIVFAVEIVDRALTPTDSSDEPTSEEAAEDLRGAMLWGTGEGLPAREVVEGIADKSASTSEPDEPVDAAWRGTLTVLGPDDKPMPGHRLLIAWVESNAAGGLKFRIPDNPREYRTDKNGLLRYAAPNYATSGRVEVASNWSGRFGDDLNGVVHISRSRPDRVLRYAPRDVLRVTVTLPNGDRAAFVPIHFYLNRTAPGSARDARPGVVSPQPVIFPSGGTLFSPAMRARYIHEGAARGRFNTRFGSTNGEGLAQQDVPRVAGTLLIIVPRDPRADQQTHRGARIHIKLGEGAPEEVHLELQPVEDIEGIVVDDQGHPLADVLVIGWPDTLEDTKAYGAVDFTAGDGPAAGMVLDLMTRTDARGRFKARLRHRGPHRFLADPDRHSALRASRPALCEGGSDVRLVCRRVVTSRFRMSEDGLAGTPVLIEAHDLLRKGVKTIVAADNSFQARLVEGAEYTIWILSSDKSGLPEADHLFYARHRIQADASEDVVPVRRLRTLSGRLRHAGIGSIFPVTANLGPWSWSALANPRGEFTFPALPREAVTVRHSYLLDSSGEVVTSHERGVSSGVMRLFEVVAQPDAEYVELPEDAPGR